MKGRYNSSTWFNGVNLWLLATSCFEPSAAQHHIFHYGTRPRLHHNYHNQLHFSSVLWSCIIWDCSILYFLALAPYSFSLLYLLTSWSVYSLIPFLLCAPQNFVTTIASTQLNRFTDGETTNEGVATVENVIVTLCILVKTLKSIKNSIRFGVISGQDNQSN